MLSDVNADGIVDHMDLLRVAISLGQSPPLDEEADVNRDGFIDVLDLTLVGLDFGKEAKDGVAIE